MCIFHKVVKFIILPFLFPFQSLNLTNSWRYQEFKSESVNDVAADEADHLTDADIFKMMISSLKNQEKADILRKLAGRISEMC